MDVKGWYIMVTMIVMMVTLSTFPQIYQFFRFFSAFVTSSWTLFYFIFLIDVSSIYHQGKNRHISFHFSSLFPVPIITSLLSPLTTVIAWFQLLIFWILLYALNDSYFPWKLFIIAFVIVIQHSLYSICHKVDRKF